MKTRYTGSFLIGLAAAVLFAPAASSTVVEHMTIEQLAQTATLVVLGTVDTVASQWNEDNTKIYTHIQIRPQEILKGDPSLTGVHVKQIGGTVDQTSALLPGSPQFTPGERVLLFLEGRLDKDGYMVIGLFQGKYNVVEDLTDAGQIVERDVPSRGISLVDATGRPTTQKHTLAEVRVIVAGGAK